MAAVADRVKESVVRTLSRYNMLRFGPRLGVAVSGGADSVCLLHVLAGLAPKLGLDLTVLHVKHHLRGEESDGDAAFVAELAASLGLSSEQRSLDPAVLKNGNLEQNARQGRLECFGLWRRLLGLDAVALAHTRSDQAETVLMRIVRGTAPAGLAAIQPVTSDRRIRPLIETPSSGVRQWLSERRLAWREDSSNRSLDLMRNRIRLAILPLLAEENPKIEAALARLATLTGEEELYWARLTARILEEVSTREGQSIILDTAQLAGMEKALARRVLKLAAELVSGSGQGLELIHYEQLFSLATDRCDGTVTLAGLVALRSFNGLRLTPDAPATDAAQEFESVIPGPGVFGQGWLTQPIRLERGDLTPVTGPQFFLPGCRYNGDRHWLDGDLIAFPLVLRVWRHGDRYQPQGARREYSLHELFQRARVPRWERAGWPVIIATNRIVWARRFGVADWAAAAPGRSNPIEVREAAAGS